MSFFPSCTEVSSPHELASESFDCVLDRIILNRMIKVERQDNNFTCGFNSSARALAALEGRWLTDLSNAKRSYEDQCLRILWQKFGLLPEKLARFIERVTVNISATPYHATGFVEYSVYIKALLTRNTPVIVLLARFPYMHYVTVIGWGPKEVVILDTNGKIKLVPIGLFQDLAHMIGWVSPIAGIGYFCVSMQKS